MYVVTGETKIGLSYAKLCQSVKPGNTILIADGAISIEVQQILNDKELRGVVINSHKLGQRKNCNLPGACMPVCAYGALAGAGIHSLLFGL
jgi:pyruvate kinase